MGYGDVVPRVGPARILGAAESRRASRARPPWRCFLLSRRPPPHTPPPQPPSGLSSVRTTALRLPPQPLALSPDDTRRHPGAASPALSSSSQASSSLASLTRAHPAPTPRPPPRLPGRPLTSGFSRSARSLLPSLVASRLTEQLLSTDSGPRYITDVRGTICYETDYKARADTPPGETPGGAPNPRTGRRPRRPHPTLSLAFSRTHPRTRSGWRTSSCPPCGRTSPPSPCPSRTASRASPRESSPWSSATAPSSSGAPAPPPPPISPHLCLPRRPRSRAGSFVRRRDRSLIKPLPVSPLPSLARRTQAALADGDRGVQGYAIDGHESARLRVPQPRDEPRDPPDPGGAPPCNALTTHLAFKLLAGGVQKREEEPTFPRLMPAPPRRNAQDIAIILLQKDAFWRPRLLQLTTCARAGALQAPPPPTSALSWRRRGSDPTRSSLPRRRPLRRCVAALCHASLHNRKYFREPQVAAEAPGSDLDPRLITAVIVLGSLSVAFCLLQARAAPAPRHALLLAFLLLRISRRRRGGARSWPGACCDRTVSRR